MKHKHADLIHAWANGAEIQSKDYNGTWVDEKAESLFWGDQYEYRIKPEEKKPVVRWLWADEFGSVYHKLLEQPIKDYTIKLEWSRTEFPE